MIRKEVGDKYNKEYTSLIHVGKLRKVRMKKKVYIKYTLILYVQEVVTHFI